MDITANQLKNMKSKQLRKIIREAIDEILNEETFAGKNAVPDLKSDAGYAALSADAKVNAEKELQKGGSVTLEMARLAKGFRLADPNIDASQFTKRISGVALSDIINYFRENPGAEKAQLQAQFGFARPQIANAVVNGLLDAGVLTKLSASGEEEAPVAPGEEAPTQATDVEDLFMGSAENPLSMYFDNEPNADGTEDFNAEEEPTPGEIEPSEPASTGGMSDEDYEAWDKYDTLKSRLNGVKSNLNKMKRSKGKGGVAGDIADTSSNEEQRLRDLKKSLEDRIAALVASSDYLKKRTGQSTEEPTITEPEEDETIDEVFSKEYDLRKLKYYAGIIK
jgi:hypothetical protein